MSATKRPGPAEAAAAIRILLDGLAEDRDLSDIAAELTPLHPRNNTFPGEVFLQVAADALGWCGASRADPVQLDGNAGAVPGRLLVPRPGKGQAPVRHPGSG